MRKLLLVALAMVFAVSGTAWAQGCEGCSPTKIYGYMSPNFRMIDKGEDNAANMGFGMGYNRVVWAGKIDAGKIVKKVAWKVETDLKQNVTHGLQYAWVQPMFNDNFALRVGRDKKPFSLEVLYSPANQITADRHTGSGQMASMGYASYGYGLAAMISHEVFDLHVGAYDGQGAESHVKDQDPALDYGARVVVHPPSVEGLQIGANLMMTTIPEGGNKDQGTYADTDDNEYLSNTGMAFGADINFEKKFDEKMSLVAQAEFDMGDNWTALEPGDEGDTWEDASFYKWQYLYAKARFNINPELGIYLGFSIWDPNTGTDEDPEYGAEFENGENDETTTIVPGVIYYWTKNLRTMVEVQLVTEKVHTVVDGDWVDDNEYTHFVLQQVFIWP